MVTIVYTPPDVFNNDIIPLYIPLKYFLGTQEEGSVWLQFMIDPPLGVVC
jgi:hypothetical protein